MRIIFQRALEWTLSNYSVGLYQWDVPFVLNKHGKHLKIYDTREKAKSKKIDVQLYEDGTDVIYSIYANEDQFISFVKWGIKIEEISSIQKKRTAWFIQEEKSFENKKVMEEVMAMVEEFWEKPLYEFLRDYNPLWFMDFVKEKFIEKKHSEENVV